MKYRDLIPGNEIRATSDNGQCWLIGDKFVVFKDYEGFYIIDNMALVYYLDTAVDDFNSDSLPFELIS